jgi:hypothetical protein
LERNLVLAAGLLAAVILGVLLARRGHLLLAAALLAAIILSALFAFFLGFFVGPPAALVLVAGVFFAAHSEAIKGAKGLSRRMAAASALLLACLGLVFIKVLVANPSDNAYLWIAMLGAAALAVSVLFVLAAIMPIDRARPWLSQTAIVLLWIFGAPGAVLLLLGGPLYLGRGARWPFVDNPVVVNHLVGLLVLLPSLWLVGFHWPRASRAAVSNEP